MIALSLFASALGSGLPGHAESGGDADLAALQASAKESFRDKVAPFLTTYCTDCHGTKKRKGQINFQPALKNPGDANFSKQWKQALANVKTHDMPPDEADKQPTGEERRMFMDWVAKVKFLSPKDSGPFVIRRLTKVEYGNTLHDLFGVDPAIVHELPDEVFGEGYLNTLSPLQMEEYLGIANEVLDRILAPGDAPPTELQRRLFGEPPAAGADVRAAARNVARSLARSAYRRPASEAELDVLLGVFDLGRQNKLSYPAALSLMLKAVLVSPQFLFITPGSRGRIGSRDCAPG
ncbi:MAG: DUF1595 domain-containing protein [Chthoniobacter sp.]